MRIIAGEARGRTLVAPPGSKTRPTQDYVRESLFNILGPQVVDAQVLDLFAGTGALALESISRGAAFAVLVDSDRSACEAIRKNIQAVRCEGRTELIQRDYRSAIESISRKKHIFNLVFLDPPYRMVETGEICDMLSSAGILSRDALLVVEHKKDCAPVCSDTFQQEQLRKYGDTEISFVRWIGKPDQSGNDREEALL